jgi:hypothetical protein
MDEITGTERGNNCDHTHITRYHFNPLDGCLTLRSLVFIPVMK